MVETKELNSSVVYSVKGLGIKMPALLIRVSIRPNRDTAVSAIFAAVRGSPMSPSTSERFADGGKGFVLEMFREFATTLYPRSRNASTKPAPIPWEAPVMIADFCVFGMRVLVRIIRCLSKPFRRIFSAWQTVLERKSSTSRVIQWRSMAHGNLPAVRAFLFDLDGTLVDSKLDLVNSINFMLQEMKRKTLPLDTVASYVGHGAPKLVADALGPNAGEADCRLGLEIFVAHYEKHSLEATRAYPGVVEGLQALGDHPMAVLTNKPLKMSVEILEGLGLRKFFRVVYGGDSFATKKPDPAGAQIILKD